MLKGKIHINEQECEGNLSFYGNHNVMTRNFADTFNNEAATIVFTACALVMEVHPNGADYLQTFEYEYPNGHKITFWLIIDVSCEGQQNILTALLPEDY